jgi:uncharacterized iron-regulated protein
MKHLFSVLLLTFLMFTSLAQNDRAFVIYNSKGQKVSYAKLRKSLPEKEYVFFGEHHDNPISHWLEMELLKELYTLNGSNLQVAFEMFEQDQQLLLNDYLSGVVSENYFLDSCRLWPNYKTDYKPLIQFAKENKLYCLASNVPRKYANRLFRNGRSSLDSLTAGEKKFMAPLDFKIDTSLSQYSALASMEEHMVGSHLMEAQAFKDATMAHFTLRNKKLNNTVFHINGAYHSDFYQGIVWYIQQAQPVARILTISTVTQQQIDQLDDENLGKADFIICVPESMTKTH